MRLKVTLVSANKKVIALIILGIIILIQINVHTSSQNRITNVVTIREIYSNGIRNLSQLHFEEPIRSSDAFPIQNVGFPDMARSNCHAAFSGKATNADFKESVKRWNVTKIKQYAENDCMKFRKKYGIDRYPPPLQEEIEFPLSFSVVFHQDFDQVLFLLRAVYHPQNIYCLHADKKSPLELQEAAVAVANCLPNVYVASVQEKVVYAGYTRLKADLNCMQDALQSPVNWRYHINMVGQQFPLKSNLEMVRILKLFNGSNDIEGITGGGRLVNRYRKAFATNYVKESGLYNTKETGATNPPPPHEIDIVKGSAFGTFSRAFVEYVTSDPIAAELLKWSETVYSPDEYVWATLHHSKSLKVPGGSNTGDPDKTRWFSTYANWGERSCFGKYIHGVCIFTTQDLPLLLSRHAFFANKFQMDFHPGALHCLDKLIYSLTTTNTVTDLGFYETVTGGRKGS